MISSGIQHIAQLLSIDLPAPLRQGSLRVAFAALTGCVLVLAFGPVFIRKLLEMKVGQPIRNYKGFLLAELHKQKKNTPTMGGILIVFSAVLSSLLWADWSSFFVPIIIASTCLFGAIGAVDDYAKLKSQSSQGLPGKVRLLLQTTWAAAVIIVLSSPSLMERAGFSVPAIFVSGERVSWTEWQGTLYLPFLAYPLSCLPPITWALQWFTVVGAANAVNLTDGLDGLAAGCSVLVGAVLVAAAALMGHFSFSGVFLESSTEIAVCLAAMCGACFGFLWFNAFPAQVFMGDTGSLAIGGMFGTATVLMKREWLLALAGAVFVVETLSVIIQVVSFRRSGRRIFRCAPLHHHFEYGGLHEAKVVMRFWIVTVFCATLGLISLLGWSP